MFGQRILVALRTDACSRRVKRPSRRLRRTGCERGAKSSNRCPPVASGVPKYEDQPVLSRSILVADGTFRGHERDGVFEFHHAARDPIAIKVNLSGFNVFRDRFLGTVDNGPSAKMVEGNAAREANSKGERHQNGDAIASQKPASAVRRGIFLSKDGTMFEPPLDVVAERLGRSVATFGFLPQRHHRNVIHVAYQTPFQRNGVRLTTFGDLLRTDSVDGSLI